MYFRKKSTFLALKICILHFLELFLYIKLHKLLTKQTNQRRIMILQFKVKNYRSIRDEQSISFETTKDRTNRDLLAVEVKPNLYINKLGIFYGANASGKSNMIEAMTCLFIMMVVPAKEQDMPIKSYIPFALNDGEPTSFDITFFRKGIQYDYSILYNRTQVLKEELYYYPGRSRALFYSRNAVENGTQPKVDFGSSLKLSAKSKQTLRENTYNNHTVLSTTNKITLKDDAASFIELYEWLLFNVNLDFREYKEHNMVAEMSNVISDADKKEFYINMLKKSDFNITNFDIVDKNHLYSQKMLDMIKSLPEEQQMSMIKDVAYTSHTVNGDFQLPSELQSKGTLKYTELLDDLYEAITGDHIYLFDEIGVRLHSALTEYYIDLFLRNSNQSQMFFTTHNILLLEAEFIRRDVVYLTEKNRDTAESEYKRVSDMGLHKNLSLYHAYKQGKLGAIPSLGSPYIVRKTGNNCK